MRSEQLRRYLICVVIGFVLIRLLGPAWRTGFVPAFPDSSSYQAVADRGPYSFKFWIDERPPTYPLLIWLVGGGARAIVVTQTLLAALSWAWLVSTVWQLVTRRPVAIAAMLMLVLIAVQTRWLFWDTAILTESLSGTLAVGGIAAWWRWFDRPERWRLGVATAITVAWMLLRDSNAVTLFVVAVPAVAVVLLLERRSTSVWRRGMAVALAAMIVTGAYSLSAQLVTDRGETSFHNNVGLRWLPDEDMSSWMAARGMPVTDALLERSGKDAWADGDAFLESPFLDEYRSWADGRGRTAAAESFVLRADWYLGRFGDEIDGYASTDHLAYDTYRVAQNFPERPLGPLDPVAGSWSMLAWSLAAAASIAAAWFSRRRQGWMLLFFAVPVVSDMYLSFAADGVEVGRHLVGPMLRFAVITVVAVAVAVDALLGALRPVREDAWIDVEAPGHAELLDATDV